MYKLMCVIAVFIVSACSAPAPNLGGMPAAVSYQQAPERLVDKVIVDKSNAKMVLLKNDKPVRKYNIALGGNPIGHKVQEGDMRTPEGVYNLEYKNDRSKFYKSIKISYPNAYDIARAQLRGVDPGGDIVIHGLPNGITDADIGARFKKSQNWTQGCIAVSNAEMDEIWQLVALDTPIEIRP
jgi:murein L,D-transpeptidase YafK